jgi:hypothetical protein
MVPDACIVNRALDSDGFSNNALHNKKMHVWNMNNRCEENVDKNTNHAAHTYSKAKSQ